MQGAAVPVVFDTDVGTDVDDALALALALGSPEIDLRAVCVGNGDAPLLDLRARIAARLLALAGRRDVPVLRGHPQRLSASDRHTHLGHEGDGLLDVPHDGEDAPILDIGAPDWLIAQSRRERLHVVATGPFTNLAVALGRDPGLASRLAHLSVMGGMVHPEHFSPYWQGWLGQPGNRGEQLDYNSACDPGAALACARSGVPMTWVTIEITLRTGMTREALRRLGAAGTPLCAALARLTAIWAQRHYRHEAHDLPGTVANYHDPLAMAAVFGGPWLSLRREPLRCEVEDGLLATRPAAPGAADAVEAEVSVDVDPAAFEALWLDRVLGL
ncbi:MAG TPA: nucleoside hydrolase [Candidatus Dormibacteraeota bacterium]|nr:nucleoside hydrolase [Candidatus Dormibacteraeota bacterium]